MHNNLTNISTSSYTLLTRALHSSDHSSQLIATMGNTASNSHIKVITNNGRVQSFSRPVRALELMAGNPGQFVCDSDCLRVGCRVPGLAGDDELCPDCLYFLLPVDLLYSVLTEEEMASLTSMTSTKRRKNYIGRRIFPVLSDFCLIPSESKKVVEEEPERWWAEEEESSSGGEVARQRSWRPALDTIEEAK